MSQQVKLTPREPELWGQRVDELGLHLEKSPIAPLIERVAVELAQANIAFRPRFYVANEWGCPDGQPLIGIPFYLVDPRLHAFEEDHADDLEDSERILMGIRHEVGHALNYAYRLYAEPEWEEAFGKFNERYHDDYDPLPFAKRCIRHLPGWYAQKHPDEDFAETFAVWITCSAVGSDWRQLYADGPVARKLHYVEQAVGRIGSSPPTIHPDTVTPDPNELAFTVGEFYTQRAIADSPPVHELGTVLDEDLRSLFSAEGLGIDAANLILEQRKTIMRSVSNYAGSRLYVVKALLDALSRRVRELGLRASHGKELEALVGITAMATVLVKNFLRYGHFVPA